MQLGMRIFIKYPYIHVYIEYFVYVVKRKREFCEFLCKLKVAKAFILWYHILTNQTYDISSKTYRRQSLWQPKK